MNRRSWCVKMKISRISYTSTDNPNEDGETEKNQKDR